jgi:hypothetical protein
LDNLLKRDFTTQTINEKWVADITYIHTLKDGWCYLASVLEELVDEEGIPFTLDPFHQDRVALETLKDRAEEIKGTKELLHSNDYLDGLTYSIDETYPYYSMNLDTTEWELGLPFFKQQK